jgi:very-short-patch-repair endonuclease
MAHSENGKLRIRQSLIGNTHALGHKQSEEAKLKKSTALKGRIPWNKGKLLKNETCLKISIARKGVSHPWMKRPKSPLEKERLRKSSKNAWNDPAKRQKYLDGLEKSRWIKVRSDIGQLELLEKWNRLGFHLEPNFQVRKDADLFYIDGYDPIHNVVIEYDGKYHDKPSQQQKDLIRQQKIIDILHPKFFWRYNVARKKFSNILEGTVQNGQ